MNGRICTAAESPYMFTVIGAVVVKILKNFNNLPSTVYAVIFNKDN